MSDQDLTPQPPAPEPPKPEGDGNYKRSKRKLRERIVKPRFRFTYIWVFGILSMLAAALADPDQGFIRQLPFGASTIATLIILTKGIVYCGLLHFSRKGLMDYFDMEEAWNRSKNNPLAAAVYTLGVGLYTVAMALVIQAAHIR
jgi:hypothetical protein